MDPFEIRMQFVSLISRLTSTVPSISKVASFALKHASRASDDIWDCYLDEIASTNLNSRINLLYLVDTLLDKEGPKVVGAAGGAKGALAGLGSYREMVERDLAQVVRSVVPDSREGVLNWMSTYQVLRSWKTRRLLDSDVLDAVTAELEERKAALHTHSSDSTSLSNFSRNDILRRIEDDRERHKRLKERIWVLPVPSTIYTTVAPSSSSLGTASTKPSPMSPASPFDPSSRSSASTSRRPSAAIDKPPPVTAGRGPELALEMEFEQLWEANEEERRAAQGPDSDEDDGDGALERPVKRLKVWPLEEADREEMRSERWGCFEPEKEEGEV